MLATESAGARCCECPAMLLLWWSAWCRGGHDPFAGHGSPSADHDSHGQRKTYILPGGHLRLLHSVVVGSCRSFLLASAHLNLAAKSFQSDEERAAPNQHARARTHEKVLLDPSLHSW